MSMLGTQVTPKPLLFIVKQKIWRVSRALRKLRCERCGLMLHYRAGVKGSGRDLRANYGIAVTVWGFSRFKSSKGKHDPHVYFEPELGNFRPDSPKVFLPFDAPFSATLIA
jgi:hypothetical protein